MRQRARSYIQTAKWHLLALFAPGSETGRRGQELVEYALLAGFVAVTVAATVPFQVTAPLATIFSKIKVHLVTHGG